MLATLSLASLAAPSTLSTPSTPSTPSTRSSSLFSPSSADLFTDVGTTCADLIESERQEGCFSASAPGSSKLATKFVSYVDDWSTVTTTPVDLSSPSRQVSCDLPVAVDIVTVVDAAKYQRRLRDDPSWDSIKMAEWIYGVVPAQYGLMSTYFSSSSSFTADGKPVGAVFTPTSTSREFYSSIVFDTSHAAAAWIEWTNANDLAHGMSYRGIGIDVIVDLASPNNRFEVSGMCDSKANELASKVPYYWDFGSVAPFSIAIPVRKVPSSPASVVNMSLSANTKQFVPFDNWKDTVGAALQSSSSSSSSSPSSPSPSSSCKTRMEALHMQCTPLKSTTTLASHYYTTSNPNASNRLYQTSSCSLPVVVVVRMPVDVARAKSLLTPGANDAAKRARGIVGGDGFTYAVVPGRHALVSSVVGSSSTLTAQWTSIFKDSKNSNSKSSDSKNSNSKSSNSKSSDSKSSDALPRNARVTLSFVDSGAALAWIEWFATEVGTNGQNNGGGHYTLWNLFDPSSRVVVHGMCAKGVAKFRESVRLPARVADLIDFAFFEAASVRPTRDFRVKPSGWK